MCQIILLSPYKNIRAELEKIGVDQNIIRSLTKKSFHYNILLKKVKCGVANILKQEMLSLGGDVATNKGSVNCTILQSDVLIMGNSKQIDALINKILLQPFGLNKIARSIKMTILNFERKKYILRTPRRILHIGKRALIMGILNLTPDSFSDGGYYNKLEIALDRALQIQAEGADIIDIGGESSRPGSDRVSFQEECNRILPFLKKISGKLSIPISIDTMKADVARIAIENGVEIINDITALRFDPKMLEIAVKYAVPVILMHMCGEPKTMQKNYIPYQNMLEEIIFFFQERIKNAILKGISSDQIIIDPGFGFGKSINDNLNLLSNLKEFKLFGKPILIGISRKNFLQKISNIITNNSNNLEGNIAAITIAILNGANIIRVHDVSNIKKAVLVIDAIKNYK